MIKISLTQFLTFKSCVSTSARLNYVHKQKYNEGYNPAHDYWKYFRDAVQNLPENNDLSLMDRTIDKVGPDKKPNYTRAVTKFKNFVRNKNITFFNVGKAKWNMEDFLTINTSPDVGMKFDGKRYFVKVFPNVSQTNRQLNFRSVQSTLTLMQCAKPEFDTSDGHFAVLRINGTKFYEAKPISKRNISLLKIDARNFVNCWNEI